jgi:hypothetical protein
MKYIKKQIIIEAVELQPDRLEEMFNFLGESKNYPECKIGGIDPADGKFNIKTLEGVMVADIGDFIIKGVKGEFYPCKPDIFAMTYDKLIVGANA